MKKSKLDLAIDSLKADRAVLDMAIARLEAQQVKPVKGMTVRKPKFPTAEAAGVTIER